MLVKYWSNAGQILVETVGGCAEWGMRGANRRKNMVKYWPNTGQTLAKHWSNTGHKTSQHWSKLVKHWSDTFQAPLKRIAGALSRPCCSRFDPCPPQNRPVSRSLTALLTRGIEPVRRHLPGRARPTSGLTSARPISDLTTISDPFPDL